MKNRRADLQSQENTQTQQLKKEGPLCNKIKQGGFPAKGDHTYSTAQRDPKANKLRSGAFLQF